MRTFYEALKAIYGPSHQIQAPLCPLDRSTLLTDKEAILKRWSEHFKGLFSDQCSVQESSLAKIPHLNVKLELDDRLIHKVIKKATNHLEVGKSPGTDGISAEVYQHGGEAAYDKLHDLFVQELLGERDSTAGPQGCSHCLSVQKQGRKIRLFKLPRHALHCRQNLGSRLAE